MKHRNSLMIIKSSYLISRESIEIIKAGKIVSNPGWLD
jgi:selenophosphate synthetase-related protein